MEKSSTKKKIYRAIGLMSGTAMDGIDAALIETDGYDYIRPIAFESVTHTDGLRAQLRACLNKTDRSADVIESEKQFTLAQTPIINKLIKNMNLLKQDCDIIGFHGQTIHHNPDEKITIQLGDGQLLANEMGINVVYDFRTNDMKNGGQGAPFLPVYHRALVKNSNLPLPVIILNLGGVGNITYIDDDTMIAFDTGPANAMIDDWIKSNTGDNYDADGTIAAKGKADQARIDSFLSLDYFKKPYPKSLDRNDFKTISVDGLTLENGAATLTEMTIQSIARGIALCPKTPTALYVAGGGRHNSHMMQRITQTIDLPTHNIDILGWDGDATEAQGFAYMAVRSLLNEPISFPTTTGCSSPCVGGKLAKAN